MVLGSCSTTNQSGFVQTTQNITSHYNRYYNANAVYTQTLKSLKKGVKEDYFSMLSVYDYGTPEDAALYGGDFKKVMDKASLAIARKDTLKAELSRWADNAYLLIGQSEYLQGDYEASSETFRYIVSEFESGFKSELMDERYSKKKYKKYKPKKYQRQQEKKKDEVNKELSYGAFKHIPSRNEALIWLAKSEIMKGNFEEADNIIAFTEADKLFPTNFQKDLVKVQVFYQMEQENYSLAVKPLNELIELTKKKKEKARYYYILGQIALLEEDYEDAFNHFNAVLSNNPSFDLQFYAQLQIAITAYRSSQKPSKIKKTLLTMTKDTKNQDKMGLVYYALGILELSDSDEGEAEQYLLESLKYPFGETDLKSDAYLALAELYYDQEEFRLASNYYDTTIVVIDKLHPDLYEIEQRKIALNRLVSNMDIVNLQDSLLTIAAFDDRQLKRYLDEEIARIEEANEEAIDATINPQKIEGGGTQPQTNTSVSFAGTGKFYWNNQQSISQGYNQFRRVWGDRKLEDDWRRKDKTNVISFDDNTEDTTGLDQLVDLTDYDAERQKILENIPLTPEAKSTANNAIITAYYDMAVVYRNELENNPKAIETFELLNKRYPLNEYRLESYYSLYLLYAKEGNRSKSNEYKSKLINEYPESKYAQAIMDPNFIEESQEEKDKLNAYYEKTFEYYQKGKYNQVIGRAEEAGKLFASNDLEPKFELLAAMSLGGMRMFKDYQTALRKIISDYPEDDVSSKAQELLAVIDPNVENVGGYSGLPEPKPQPEVTEEEIEAPSEEGSFEEALEEAEAEALEEEEAEIVEPEVEETEAEEEEAEVEPVVEESPEIEEEPEAVEPEPVEPVVVLPEDTVNLEGLPYGVSPNSPHQFSILIVDRSLSSSKVKSAVESFLSDSTAFPGLEVSSTYLNLSTKVVNVKSFNSDGKAMDFWQAITANDGPLSEFQPNQYRAVVISSLNYTMLLANKDVYGYSKFFKVNYLGE